MIDEDDWLILDLAFVRHCPGISRIFKIPVIATSGNRERFSQRLESFGIIRKCFPGRISRSKLVSIRPWRPSSRLVRAIDPPRICGNV